MEKYLNPYTAIGPKYTAGLNAIAGDLAALYPNQTIDDLVNSVYNYVTTTYGMSMGSIEQQELKSIIYTIINGYMNYQPFYNAEQMNFINQLISGTLACGNPEDILQHILDTEAAIAESGLSMAHQMPLLYATAVGKAAYTYWAAIVTTPGSWTNFVNSFTPAIQKFPYWLAASMQGALIGLNILIASTTNKDPSTIELLAGAKGVDVVLPLLGSLAVCSGKVVFNLQQKEIIINNNFRTLLNNNDGPPPAGRMLITVGILWGIFHPTDPQGHQGGCEPKWGLCGFEISVYLAGRNSSSATATIVNGRLHIKIAASDAPFEYAQQLATKVIPVGSDIQLPSEICCKLGISNYTIKAGNYNFTSCCEGYHFIF